MVNGSSANSPLNAVTVMYNETAQFTPIEKLKVFLSGYQNNGYVISKVTGDALEVEYTDSNTQSIYFDDATNRFRLGSPPKKLR